jgi:hypothetical protein
MELRFLNFRNKGALCWFWWAETGSQVLYGIAQVLFDGKIPSCVNCSSIQLTSQLGTRTARVLWTTKPQLMLHVTKQIHFLKEEVTMRFT